MNDPFATLGIAEEADDETVRKAYLRLVRLFPPEREPLRFQEIRAAYDLLADRRDRLAFRLFQAPKPDVVPLLAALLQEGERVPPAEATFREFLQEAVGDFRLPAVGTVPEEK